MASGQGTEVEFDRDVWRARMREADAAMLLLVLVQLTGERHWLDRARPYIQGPMSYQQRIPDSLAAEIAERLIEVLAQSRADGREASPPDDDLLLEMMSLTAGEPVQGDYAAMMREELFTEGPDPRALHWRGAAPSERVRDFRVVIIGAGVSGLCAAIRLQEAGIAFVILEKNRTVGGTWYENRYPGCGVDTPNHFYSFSFEPNHDWSHFFAKRDELWQYFERVADKYGLRSRICFDTEVERATFDEASQTWRVTARDRQGQRQEWQANAVISAVGVLNRAKRPEIPGLDQFQGPVVHTAEWDQNFDWRGKRIAMIGTGASGHQVGPSIAPDVARLTIFQRSPHWVVPNPNYHEEVREGKKWALANIPYYARWYRFALFWGFADGLHSALQVDPDWPDPARSLNAVNQRHRQFMERHIRSEIGDDPELLAKVIPPYPPYGKRILIDNHWFRMLKRDNVDLVTDKIAAIRPRGIETADAKFWPADAIVLATGFHASRVLWPMQIIGRGGRDLRSLWGPDDARAYLGVSVPGFPNFFILTGPNTGLAHGGNQIFMSECGVRYVMQALRELLERGARSLECRQDVHDTYNATVDRLHAGMVWTHKGLTNWYRNAQGRVFAISPWRLVDYWKMTSRFDPNDYHIA